VKMTKKLRRSEELKRWQERYARRNREGKVRMLDEFCEQYGYERKYAAKLLACCLPPPKGVCPSGPEPRYEPLREVIETIWHHAEQLCGKRLEPALELWVPHYEKHYAKLLPIQKKLLGQISAATLDRMLSLGGVLSSRAHLCFTGHSQAKAPATKRQTAACSDRSQLPNRRTSF
jgi:hypothetical protein